jgi:hypothetical protein
MANTAPKPQSPAAGEPLALLIWVAVNWGSLSMSAVRWPLWPGAPRPVESTAAWQLIAIDTIVASLFCPVFLSRGRRAALVAVSTGPFLEMAGFLSGVSLVRLAIGFLILTIWLASLFFWCQILPGRRGRMMVVATAGVWTIGLPVLEYLFFEFRQSGAVTGVRSIAGDTPWGLISDVLAGRVPNVFIITILGIFLAAGGWLWRVRLHHPAGTNTAR